MTTTDTDGAVYNWNVRYGNNLPLPDNLDELITKKGRELYNQLIIDRESKGLGAFDDFLPKAMTKK